MKKKRVMALLGLFGVFLSSGLKSSGMENNNIGGRGGNNASFFSNILNYWPIPAILGGLGLIKKASDSGNKEIGYEDVDYINPKYTQNCFYKTQYGSILNLTPGDQNWIDRNVILLNQKEGSSYCWHNASMNYIFAPEFINMTGLPKKIKTMVDWGKKQLKKESDRTNNFSARLAGAVEVPKEVRKLPDGLENWLDGSEDIIINRGKPFMFNNAAEMDAHTGNKEIKFNSVNIRDLFTNIKDGNCSDASAISNEDNVTILSQRVKDLEKGFTFSFMYPKSDYLEGKDILWFNASGYYPTCVVVNHFGGGHYTTLYFVYDGNKNIKFCVYLDGNCGNYGFGTKGIQILTYQEAVQKIREATVPQNNFKVGDLGGGIQGSYHVRYSTEDIVNKYYTSKN